MIVDSHITPEAARAMLRELKAITDKPVTHAHQHALPLRPHQRQPGVPGDGGHHRPRVHADEADRPIRCTRGMLAQALAAAPEAGRGAEGARGRRARIPRRRRASSSSSQVQTAYAAAAAGTEADAAQRHDRRSDDALPRRPRDPADVSRPRPHRRRPRRLPAEGARALQRRPAGERHRESRRRLRQRLARHAREAASRSTSWT